MKRAAMLLVATVLTASALAACDSGSDSTGGSTASASSSASSTPKSESTAAPAEANAALACGRYFNGGTSSLNTRIAAVVPVMEAQDAGTPLDEDQTTELGAIDSALVLAVKVSPDALAEAYTSIQDRIQGALAAAESGGANAATLDYPTVSGTIVTECTAAGFPVS